MLTIEFKTRDNKIKADKMRRDGAMPAVFYGPKEKSTPIAINDIEFKKVWKKAGESSIVILKNKEGDEHEALIHEVDLHPVTGVPRHADFYVIEKGKKLQIKVPLEFEGISAAVKDMAGTLVKVLHEVEIEALPKDLPHDLKVDISKLETLESQVLAKDIVLPAGVTLVIGPDEVVAAVSVVKEEVEETKTIDDIEVVGAKGKDEEATAEGDAKAEPAADKKEDKKDKK